MANDRAHYEYECFLKRLHEDTTYRIKEIEDRKSYCNRYVFKALEKEESLLRQIERRFELSGNHKVLLVDRKILSKLVISAEGANIIIEATEVTETTTTTRFALTQKVLDRLDQSTLNKFFDKPILVDDTIAVTTFCVLTYNEALMEFFEKIQLELCENLQLISDNINKMAFWLRKVPIGTNLEIYKNEGYKGDRNQLERTEYFLQAESFTSWAENEIDANALMRFEGIELNFASRYIGSVELALFIRRHVDGDLRDDFKRLSIKLTGDNTFDYEVALKRVTTKGKLDIQKDHDQNPVVRLRLTGRSKTADITIRVKEALITIPQCEDYIGYVIGEAHRNSEFRLSQVHKTNRISALQKQGSKSLKRK